MHPKLPTMQRAGEPSVVQRRGDSFILTDQTDLNIQSSVTDQ